MGNLNCFPVETTENLKFIQITEPEILQKLYSQTKLCILMFWSCLLNRSLFGFLFFYSDTVQNCSLLSSALISLFSQSLLFLLPIGPHVLAFLCFYIYTWPSEFIPPECSDIFIALNISSLLMTQIAFPVFTVQWSSGSKNQKSYCQTSDSKVKCFFWNS